MHVLGGIIEVNFPSQPLPKHVDLGGMECSQTSPEACATVKCVAILGMGTVSVENFILIIVACWFLF